MMFTMAGELRRFMPAVLMGCHLLKVPINKLNRAKMTNILRTADAHNEIIVNSEEDEFARMTMETATRKWIEVCESMDWECKDYLILIGGTGKICEPLKSLKAYLESVQIDQLRDNCPILVDNDWFKKVADFENKKRKLSVVDWNEESFLTPDAKKPETEIAAKEVIESNDFKADDEPEKVEAPSSELNSALEEFKLKTQLMLEEQKQDAEQKMKELSDHYELRIKRIQEHNELVANDADDQAKENEQVVTDLKNQLRQKEHEKIVANHDVVRLQTQVQDFEVERRQWQVEMSKLRDLIQSQGSMIHKDVKQEPSVAEITFGTVEMDSDDETPMHSSPCRAGRKINELTKGLPTSLAKLGMPVFNPAKQSKIEYLNKFVMLVEDFDSTDDFKVIKQMIYQAFAEDRNFRIQDLTSDDKSSLQKLAMAIIKQDEGDSIDLMKTFEAEHLKHGESHLNYMHRVGVLYGCAANLDDAKWKEEHIHAQKIYNKIDDSLPTNARSKFRELMMEDRKNSSMKFSKIRACLETVILIFGDELKTAMGSQRHVVPIVDAIQSKPKQFTNKKDCICWNCGSSGHMKRFCPEKGNNREPKTSGRRDSVKCFFCGGFGHFAAKCPNKREGNNKWSGNDGKNKWTGRNKWSHGAKNNQ